MHKRICLAQQKEKLQLGTKQIKSLTCRNDIATKIYQQDNTLARYATKIYQYLLVTENIYFSPRNIN